jgi:hypothetical protein
MQDKMQAFAKDYKEAKSEQKKLQLCIDAIDQGLIYLGGPVENIDKIFGTTYSKKLPTTGQELKTGVVDFVHLAPPPSNDIQAAFAGWYLAFEFDQQGRIRNYYLSNLYK